MMWSSGGQFIRRHKVICSLVLLFVGLVGALWLFWGTWNAVGSEVVRSDNDEHADVAHVLPAGGSGASSVASRSAVRAGGLSSQGASVRRASLPSSFGSLVKRVDDSRTVFKGMEDHFELISASPQETRFRFELGGYEVREVEVHGVKRSLVSVSDGWQSQERGYPSLPRFVSTLACPLGKGFRVEVVDAEWDEVRCARPVASLGLYVRGRVPEYSEKKELYEGQESWPQSLAVVGVSGQIRGVSLSPVTVSAASYDFGRGVLRLCRRCELRVVSDDACGEDYGVVSRDMDFRRLQTRHVLNGELLRGRSAGTRVGTLLMIVPDGWKSSVSSYASWKRQLGYEVMVSGYPSETGSGKAGISERIRRGYEREGVTHVVLIGGGDHLPAAIYRSAAKRENPGIEVAVSDVPYGLMDGDGDLRQDVFLSRLCVRSSSELGSVLVKFRRYERCSGSDSWRGKGIFVASEQGYSSESYIPEEFRNQCDWSVVDKEQDRLYQSGALHETHCEYGAQSNLESLISAWHGGAGLVTYMGHGDTVSWITTGFSTEDVPRLGNGLGLPFVSSCVCLTGNFGSSVPCLAEGLVSVSDGGACGMLASTNEVYLFPPLYMMQRLHDDIIGATESKRFLTLGGYGLSSITRGIDYCLSSGYSAEECREDARMLATQFHVFGDCSLAGRFRPSEQLTVEMHHDEAKGILDVTVLCGGVGREGSTVMVTDEGGTFRRWARTGAGGKAQLTLDSSVTGELSLAVFDPLGGYVEVGKGASADLDGDGQVGHVELLEVLNGKHPELTAEEALAEWRTSGSADQVETEEEQRPGELVQAGVAPENDYSFDCRKNPGGTCLADEDGLSVGTPDQVFERTERLWLKNWEVCRPFYVGESVEGRRIVGVRLGSVESFEGTRVQLLIAGGIHGNEEASVEAALGLAERVLALRQDGESSLQGPMTEILRRSWIYVIPCLNPDGLFHGMRGNAQGVDLDRAFPDGMASQLGTPGAGDSLLLWETVAVGDTQLVRGQIPEVRSLMRWCGAHRLSGALLLHSGGSHVYYPYGRSESGSYGEHHAPDQPLLEELASGYAANTRRADDSPVNGAAWASVSGELGDWLYRYLGVMPLTVEVCASRLCPKFEDWPGKFIDDQVMGVVWWLERCLMGVGGKVVEKRSGNGIPGVKVSISGKNVGMPMVTDGEGRFFRIGDGKGASVIHSFAKDGYKNTIRTLGTGQNVVMRLTDAGTGWITGRVMTMRPVPGCAELLELSWARGKADAGKQVLHLDAPQGWRFLSNTVPEEALAWRWDVSGGLSLVLPESSTEVKMQVVPGTLNMAEDRLRLTLISETRQLSDTCHAISAERMTGTMNAGLSALTVFPEGKQDAKGWTWRDDRYVLEPVSQWGRGYWINETQTKINGWFPESRTIRLSPGWNLFGVPWTMPIPKNWKNVMTEENGQYVVGRLLKAGKGVWLFSKDGKTLEW